MSETMSPAGFTDVDRSPEPSSLVSILSSLDSLPETRRLRELTYRDLAGRGVDVGCGPGTVVAELVARGVDAVGVDRSEVMLTLAREAFPGYEFRAGDACGLPFETSTLDWYRAERVYIHLRDPAGAVTEAARVLRPGGRIVLTDPVVDAISVASDDQRAVRAVLSATTATFANGHTAVRSADLLREAGFTDVRVEPLLAAYPDPAVVSPLFPGPGLAALGVEDAHRMLAECRRRAAQGSFFAAIPFFVVTGCAGE